MSNLRPQRGCLWPMWPHSSQPTHEYCGGEKLPERSYCPEHYTQSVRSSDEPRRPFIPRRHAA